ncbi:MAG TPA: ATP-binding protein [Azospirillaceae bacterium]|nr:ATP-binding protein [Azospirillaceae bacterium]
MTGAPSLGRQRRSTITTRIAIGFGIFIALVLALGLTAYTTLSGVRGDLNRYFATGDGTRVAAEAEPLFRDLDAAVRDLNQGTSRDNLHPRALALRDELDRRLGESLASVEDADDRKALEETRQVLGDWWKAVGMASGQRAEAERTVTDILHPYAEQMRLRLEQGLNVGDVTAVRLAGGAAVNVMLMRDYVSRYVDRHAPDDAKRVRTEIALAKSRLADLLRTLGPSPVRAPMAEVDNLLSVYADAFDKMVQLTTDAEKLKAEVVEPKGQTIATRLNEVRSRPLARDASLKDRLEQGAQGLTRTTLIVAVIIALTGLMVAWLMARTISRPYAALTGALNAVADDRLDAPIPALERTDEFGDMARALARFREHRIETESRLAVTEREQKDRAVELRAETDRLRERDASLREEKLQVRDEQNRLRDERLKLRTDQEAAAAESERLAGESRRFSQEEARLKTEADRLAGEALHQTDIAQRLRELQERVDAESQRLQHHQQRLQVDLEAMQQHQRSLAELEERLTAEAERLRAEQERLQTEAQRLEADRARFDVEKVAQTADRDQLDHEAQTLRTEAQRLAEERTRLEAQAQALKAEADRLRREDDRLRDEAHHLALDEERLKAEADQLSGERERLRGENEDRRTAAERLAAEEERLAGESQRLAAETERLAGESARLAEELHRIEARATELHETETAALDSRVDFLDNLDRELRGPVNAIIGYSQTLMDEIDRLKAWSLAPDAELISFAGEQLLGALDSGIELARLESGRVEVVEKSFDVAHLIDDVREMAEPVAELNGNTLVIDCPSDIGSVTSDFAKVQVTLINLLDHACKTTENGEILLSVERVEDEGGSAVRFTVTDTGQGLDLEQQAHLFDPFAAEDTAPIRPLAGATGLGMAIAARFTRILGGALRVESAPGAGTTVRLTLPAQGMEDNPDKMCPGAPPDSTIDDE